MQTTSGWGGESGGGLEGRGTETDEQLCQVDFAPLGKGNLSVGEETAGGEIKVTKEKDKVSGVEGVGGLE